jgi:hypothetical protein
MIHLYSPIRMANIKIQQIQKKGLANREMET